MRAIQFANAAGQVVSVDDFGGQHVLLHVWASGCEPCLNSLPQLKADLARLQETPFTAVGINIDGKLAASSGDWKEIRQLLKEQLKPSF